MRSMIVGIGLAALAVGAFGYPAVAEKSRMGCEIGKEVWNAGIGKCEPGTSKWHKRQASGEAKKPAKSSAKKAPEKK